MFHRKIGLGWRRKKEGVLEDRLEKRQAAGCSREVEGGSWKMRRQQGEWTLLK